MTVETGSTWAWLRLADVLLNRMTDTAAAVESDDELADSDATVTPDDAAGLEDIGAARASVRAAVEADTPFSEVAVNAWLSLDEVEALAVIAAIEMSSARQRLVEQLFGSPWLTPDSLNRLFSGLDVERSPIAPGAGLRRAALILPVEGPTWSNSAIRLAPSVSWWLLGEAARDPDLADAVDEIDVAGRGEANVVLTSGPDRVRRLQAIIAAVEATSLLVAAPPTTSAGWDALIRHATLSGRAIVLEVDGQLQADARRRIDETTHLSWAVSSSSDIAVESLPRRQWAYAEAAPALATQHEIAAVFGEAMGDAPPMLTAAQAQHLATLAPRFGGDPIQAVRWLAHGRLDKMATRISPSVTWDDLVLEPDRKALVHEVVIRQRNKRAVRSQFPIARDASMATIAMFSGASGTGKTLAAEVIAGELEFDLYQIDVSQLVSKYIGETEKNLGAVFDAAESVPCVLFFDEADALFGKRSAVSDAHDRYANIEVAYLLQRVERHQGIVVLASNLPGNVDEAFARRIHVAVEFPNPGPPERLLLWERCLPSSDDRDPDIDVQLLADTIDLSGGNIRNAAVRAFYLAAEAGSPLTMELLIEALRREMAKLGRRFPDVLRR